MNRSSLLESVLMHAAGPIHGAAIYGDLLELAVTRGRLWLLVAAVRIVVSLTWRSFAAFATGCAVFLLLYAQFELDVWPLNRAAWLRHPHITEGFVQAMLALWFLLPFSIARFGFRDRVTQLALVATLVSGCVFCCLDNPPLVLVLAGAAAASLAGLMMTSTCRQPATAVALTIASATLVNLCFGFLAHMGCWLYDGKPLNATSHYRVFEDGYAFPHTLFWVVTWTRFGVVMLTMAWTFSWLHRRSTSAGRLRVQ